MFISTNQLIKKLPKFNQEIVLPEKLVVRNDNFDSEKEISFWLAKNFLFNYLKSYYQTRKFNEENKLQSYYQVEIVGKEETSSATLNTNISWYHNSNLNFSFLEIFNFSFLINLKVRDIFVKNSLKVIFENRLNLIISFNKWFEKIERDKY